MTRTMRIQSPPGIEIMTHRGQARAGARGEPDRVGRRRCPGSGGCRCRPPAARPRRAMAATVRADGQDHFSFTSTIAPARRDPAGQVGQQRLGHHVLVEPDLGQHAEQVGEQRPRSVAAQRVRRRLAQPLDRLGRRSCRRCSMAARASAGCTGPSSRGEPVVGDQHQVDAVAGRAGGRAGPVLSRILASTPASTRSPGWRRYARHGGGEVGQPGRVPPHVVDEAQRAQPALRGAAAHVLRQRAGAVGERRVDVEVLVQRDAAAHARVQAVQPDAGDVGRDR